MSEDNNIKISMAKIETNIDFIKEELVDNKTQHKAILDRIDTFINRVDSRLRSVQIESEEKFASKWVEKGFVLIISTVLLAVVGAVLALVII